MGNKQGRYKRRQWGTDTKGRPGFITSSASPVSNYSGAGKHAWSKRISGKRKQGSTRRWNKGQ